MIENKHTVYTQGYILVFRSALEQRTKNRKQQEKQFTFRMRWA